MKFETYFFCFPADLKHKTVSLWSFINAYPEQYRNPLYGGRNSAIETVLKPIASMRHIRLWKGLYCRWNPSMRAQDPIYQRTRELLALQEQLQKQVDEVRFEKNQKQSNQTGRLTSPLHWPSAPIWLIIMLMTSFNLIQLIHFMEFKFIPTHTNYLESNPFSTSALVTVPLRTIERAAGMDSVVFMS